LLLNIGKSHFSGKLKVKTEVKLGLIFHLESTQLSAILQLNQDSVFVWIWKREELFLLKNIGKFYFPSNFQLKTEVTLGLISHLELTQLSAILQLNQDSVCVCIWKKEQLFLL